MLKNYASATLLALVLSTASADAQNSRPLTEAEKQATYDSLRGLSRSQFREMYRQQHKRKPDITLQERTSLKKSLDEVGTQAPLVKVGPASSDPSAWPTVAADARFPGEFEEVQAVFISWPYIYNSTGSSAVIDTLGNSEYAYIHGQLAKGIQTAAKVFINVWSGADSAAVKSYMIKEGMPLSNYRFFVYRGDDIWARDFGPISYYYGAQDSIGWVDFRYYPGRNYDNLLPQTWGNELGIRVTPSRIYFEGGNILMDGSNNMTTSTAVYDLNSYYNNYSKQRTRDSLQFSLKLGRNDIMPLLPHDGGTGHIDLYLDRTDENTYVFTRMPSAMAGISQFSDYDSTVQNIDTLRTRSTVFNKPNRFYSVPLPTKDNGSWYTSGPDYENYTRTYSNHLIVNKTIIQPIFSDASSGNAIGDAAALDSLKAAYPGYTFFPIDMRPFDGFGGAIHCITKEVPADNPLRFQHYAYRDQEAYQSNFPVDAIITNKSGIATAKMIWRRKNSANWTTVNMTAGSGNHWLAQIPALSANSTDTVEYYFTAASNNGKTLSRPMPGAAGAYRFWYNSVASVGSIANAPFELGNLYPNPAETFTQLEVIPNKKAQISVRILDVTGKEISRKDFGTITSRQYLQLETATLSAGIYWLEVAGNGQTVAVRKLIKD
jgi:agmatine/peptidylarginine deiminase